MTHSVIGASGGALQLSLNVSLYRLVDAPVAQVLAKRDEYEALAFVDYELLPHLNRVTPEFLAKVRAYSASIGNDVIALSDGAAVLHDAVGNFACVGTVARIRSAKITPMDAT